LRDDGTVIADCHDDGEVHRTAGEPILNVLGQMKVVNVLMVVTRYYGRIQLGPAGLTRMYSGTARDLLNNIELEEISY
jgi:putative IMPACT (imprinted ancient) family translation regulator